jgi:UDP-3-O-[3-hydroxymyristoyl] glucosamine N-acyltransferase
METEVRGWTLEELAELLEAELVGRGDVFVTHAAPAGHGTPDALTFAGSAKHLAAAEDSAVGAVIVSPDVESSSKPLLRVSDPRRTFGKFLNLCIRPLPLQHGVHPSAVVDPRAHVSPTASIGPFAVVERGAFIDDDCRVHAFCYVGEGCRLDRGAMLYPHVVLYQDVHIGERSIIHSGSIIGADGFGYIWDGERHAKVPQIGGVTIGPDVEIGSLTAVDRATVGMTKIGAGVKLDNLVQVAHNVEIGEHTVLASQTGLGGSSTIGRNVAMGGQSGVGDHTVVADGVMMAGRAGSPSSIPAPGVYAGFPAQPLMDFHRQQVIIRKLPELNKRLRELERRLAELEKKEL